MELNQFIDQYFEKETPCSFRYGGVCPGRFGVMERNPAAEREGVRAWRRRLCTADGLLEAVLEIRAFGEAVEWWLELEGVGRYDTDIVDALNFADLEISSDAKPGKYPRLIHAKGSQAQKDDFMPVCSPLSERAAHVLMCDGGRSSDGCMPYFNLQMEECAGVVLAIGWSGQWQAEFSRRLAGQSDVRFAAELPEAHFFLHPGERLELQHMLALPWDGTVEESFNRWRRVMRGLLPAYDGRPLEGYVCLRTWGGLLPQVHEAKLKNASRHQLGGELYQIDAGWHGEGTEKSDEGYFDTWWRNVGTWKPLPALYPDGLKALADSVRAAGMRFAVWFEPERMVSWNPSVDEHPDYFLGPRRPENGCGGAVWDKPFNLLVNIGREEVRKWVSGQLEEVIDSTGMEVLRIDFNARPLDFWRYGDSRNRSGVTEIKYINGLYKLFDDLLKRYPKLRIDNCASGGRRLDYRMFRFSMPMICRSDYFCKKDNEPDAKQAHTFGLSLWTSSHADSLGSCIGHTPECMDTYRFRSSLSSGIGITAPWWGLTEAEAEWYRRRIAEAKRVRAFMDREFYALTDYSLSESDWMIMQFHDPDAEKGAVLAFRRERCGAPLWEMELRGVRADAMYRVEDADTGECASVPGEALMKGYPVRIEEKRSSRILFYERI